MLNATLSFRSLLIVVTLAGAVTLSVPTLLGDDAPSDISTSGKNPSAKADPDNGTIEGTLTIKGVSYELTHVAIYETEYFDELQTIVLASSQPIPLDELTDSLKKDGTDGDFFFFKPHIKLTFDQNGKLFSTHAWADNLTISHSGNLDEFRQDIRGKIETQDGRVTGSAFLTYENENEPINSCDFDLKFSGNLIKAPEVHGPVKEVIKGVLQIDDFACELTHFVIYEARYFDELQTCVYASSEPIPLDELKDTLKNSGTDDDFNLFEPSVKLMFDSEGKLSSFTAHADGITVSRSGDGNYMGKIKTKDGRVAGSASQTSNEDETFKCDFDLKFSGNLFKANEISDKPESIAVKPGADIPDPSRDMVEGTLDVNGVSYNLAHYVIYEETGDTNGFDEDRINVLASCDPIPPEILTDKYFFFLKPQLILSFDAEGKLQDIGCRANNCDIHLGSNKLNGEIAVKEGRVSGSASYEPKANDSTKLAFNLKFAGAIQKTPKAEGDLASGGAAEKKSAALLDFISSSMEKYYANEAEFNDEVVEVEMSEKADDDDGKVEAQQKKKFTGELPNVYDLPIPEDAQNVEYKEKFDSIKFRTLSSHRSVVESLIKKLEEQGWSSEVYEYLISSEHAMIASQLGDSQIMISAYPDGQGSKVTIMFEGLSWEKKKAAEEKSAPSKKSAPKADDDSEESEKEE